MMMRILSLLALLLAPALHAESGLKILLVVGSGGTESYEKEFAETAAIWTAAAARAEAKVDTIGLGESLAGTPTDAERLRQILAAEKSPELWVVLIGHGTFDQREVKFNLRGPDLTDAEIAAALEPYAGTLSVINSASASGSFVRALSKPGRVIITSTKNEAELSYSRFGRHFAEAIAGEADADRDNDDQVSLLEAFLHAAGEVAEFYKTEGRIATEHALIDDNGDSLGSRSEWYEGTTPTQTASPEAKPDGDLAAQRVLVKNEFERLLTPEQRTRRDELERRVVTLRRGKDQQAEADYYRELEALLLELSKIYGSVRKPGES